MTRLYYCCYSSYRRKLYQIHPGIVVD